MYVPEELKVNKFVDSRIPSNRDLFARLGNQSMPDNVYTGDNPAPYPSSKIDLIIDGERSIDFDESE